MSTEINVEKTASNLHLNLDVFFTALFLQQAARMGSGNVGTSILNQTTVEITDLLNDAKMFEATPISSMP